MKTKRLTGVVAASFLLLRHIVDLAKDRELVRRNMGHNFGGAELKSGNRGATRAQDSKEKGTALYDTNDG